MSLDPDGSSNVASGPSPTSYYIITGAQLIDLKIEISQVNAALGKGDHLSRILKLLENIKKQQKIGLSLQSLRDTVNDMKNLFASWCGTTGDNK